ncbi:MAG: tetratricopeptide repeat protein [Deltaproteobacteria bacterium]|nr:MAG: tetratricopeptide repeat protein [Deltaproteobacteria bacterium]
MDLPTPAVALPPPAVDLPTPAAELPTPAAELPTPVGDLRAVDASVEGLDLGDASAGAAAGAATADAAAEAPARLTDAHEPDLRLPRGPKVLERPDPRRLLKPAAVVAGVLVLGAGGYAAWNVLSGGGAEHSTVGRGFAAGEEVTAGPAKPRSPDVLALLAQDRPPALREAIEAARAQGDLVGAAEAALWLHLRYGPDPVLLGQANEWLSSYQGNTEPFVTRVLALAAWAAGDLEGAFAKLASDGPRVDLYRGYVRFEQRRYDDAAGFARAAAKANAEDLAARYLAHAIAVATWADGAIEALEREVEAHPKHPRLSFLLAEAYVREGRLLDAAERAAKIDTTDAGPGFAADVLLLRGRIARAQGLRGEALLRFDQAKEVAPEDPRPIAERIRLLVEAHDFATAKRDVELAQNKFGEHVEVLLAAAELAIATGRGDEALELLGRAAAAASSDARVYLAMGRVYAMRMALDEAKQAFEKARELDPSRVEASAELARLYAKLRRYDEGMAVLDEHEKLLAEAKDARTARAELALARARLLLDKGERSAALEALDRALDEHRGHLGARLERARLLRAMGEDAKAESDLAFVFERAGSVPGLAATYGPILLRRGDKKALAKLLGDSLDDPRAPADLLLLGARLRLAEGKLDAAKGLADRVLEREPNNWSAHLVRGQVLMAEGDPEGAMLELQQARPTEPDAEVELWMGKVLEANGRGEEALAHYRRAVELDGDMAEARIAYGAALAARGAAKAALEQLQVVVRGDARPSAAAYVALGRAYRDLGRIEDAVAAFRKARKLDPTLREAAYWEGRILSERNKHAAAVVALERAVQGADDRQPWLPLAYRLLGRSYAELGKRSLARKAYEKFLAIADPKDPGRAEATRRLRDL